MSFLSRILLFPIYVLVYTPFFEHFTHILGLLSHCADRSWGRLSPLPLGVIQLSFKVLCFSDFEGR